MQVINVKVSNLDRRITIQKKRVSKGPEGRPATAWDDVMTVWAARQPLRGREFFAAAAVQAESTVRYVIRLRSGITSNMRVVDLKDGRIYDIIAPPIEDPFGDRTQTHLMCRGVVPDGG